MTSKVQKILSMIESVDTSDTDTLDEIDARVWCWLSGTKLIMPKTNNGDKTTSEYMWTKGDGDHYEYKYGKYTRSRDALKAIRPDGWWFDMGNSGSNNNYRWIYTGTSEESGKAVESITLPAEELAELYAIIQATEWETTND